MKHVTGQYGQPTNILECTHDEFTVLSSFLSSIGVEIRVCTRYKGEVTAQARNNHREWCKLGSDMTGLRIDKLAENQINSGTWKR